MEPGVGVGGWGGRQASMREQRTERVHMLSRSAGPLLWVSPTHSTSELAPSLPARLGPARASTLSKQFLRSVESYLV